MPSASRPPLRAVFFDAGNTLLRINYEAVAGALAGLGHPVPAGAVERAEWQARVRLDADVAAAGASTEGVVTARRYLGHLLAALGRPDEELAGRLTAWWTAYNAPVGVWELAAPGAADALRLVRAAGLGVAVISNSNGSVRSILDRLGLLPALDFVLDSHEVGVEKPDPRIFRLALERAGVEPAGAAYVGDLYSVDVRGARAAGLGAWLLDPGRCWGPRDCPTAPDVLAATRAILGAARPTAG